MSLNDSESWGRRFCLKASGIISYYIACDLDEGKARYWEEEDKRDYISLLLSENKDERDVALNVMARHAETGYCMGVHLTDKQISGMEKMLTAENIESMRGITDDVMGQRSQYFCYRDGWRLSFYAECDDGRPPLMLDDIGWCSFMDDELPFELLEMYVGSEVLHNKCEAFPYDVACKAPRAKTDAIVERALEVGMGALEEILWHGNSKLIRALDDAKIGEHLSYALSEDSFTVRFGRSISRSCKLYQRPACERVFGREHVFWE